MMNKILDLLKYIANKFATKLLWSVAIRNGGLNIDLTMFICLKIENKNAKLTDGLY